MLTKQNLTPMIIEELIASLLYTGPVRPAHPPPSPARTSRPHHLASRPQMYLKYNNVLRSFSGDTFLMSQAVYYKLAEWVDGGETLEWSLSPTKYATTIHAINSAIVKLAPLTVSASVFRGIAGMRLPDTFFERDSMGLMTGTEYAQHAAPHADCAAMRSHKCTV